MESLSEASQFSLSSTSGMGEYSDSTGAWAVGYHQHHGAHYSPGNDLLRHAVHSGTTTVGSPGTSGLIHDELNYMAGRCNSMPDITLGSSAASGGNGMSQTIPGAAAGYSMSPRLPSKLGGTIGINSMQAQQPHQQTRSTTATRVAVAALGAIRSASASSLSGDVRLITVSHAVPANIGPDCGKTSCAECPTCAPAAGTSLSTTGRHIDAALAPADEDLMLYRISNTSANNVTASQASDSFFGPQGSPVCVRRSSMPAAIHTTAEESAPFSPVIERDSRVMNTRVSQTLSHLRRGAGAQNSRTSLVQTLRHRQAMEYSAQDAFNGYRVISANASLENVSEYVDGTAGNAGSAAIPRRGQSVTSHELTCPASHAEHYAHPECDNHQHLQYQQEEEWVAPESGFQAQEGAVDFLLGSDNNRSIFGSSAISSGAALADILLESLKLSGGEAFDPAHPSLPHVPKMSHESAQAYSDISTLYWRAGKNHDSNTASQVEADAASIDAHTVPGNRYVSSGTTGHAQAAQPMAVVTPDVVQVETAAHSDDLWRELQAILNG